MYKINLFSYFWPFTLKCHILYGWYYLFFMVMESPYNGQGVHSTIPYPPPGLIPAAYFIWVLFSAPSSVVFIFQYSSAFFFAKSNHCHYYHSHLHLHYRCLPPVITITLIVIHQVFVSIIKSNLLDIVVKGYRLPPFPSPSCPFNAKVNAKPQNNSLLLKQC